MRGSTCRSTRTGAAHATTRRSGITALLARFDSKGDSGQSTVNLQQLSGAADELTLELADLLRICNTFLNQTEMASHQDLRRSMLTVAVLAGAIPLMALLASLWQYRRIMVPLDRLRRWSRRIAGGDFQHPYQPGEDRDLSAEPGVGPEKQDEAQSGDDPRYRGPRHFQF